jgi:hypothetical protein
MDLIERHGLKLDEVRDVIERDLLGEKAPSLRAAMAAE